MKVVTNTPDKLVLHNTPRVAGIALAVAALISLFVSLTFFLMEDIESGAIAFLMGPLLFGSLFIYFIHSDYLIIDKEAQTVEMLYRKAFRKDRVVHELVHLKEAIVQTDVSQIQLNGNDMLQGNSQQLTQHRAALVLDGGMDEGTHPAMRFYSPGSGAQNAADAINAWLVQNAQAGALR